MAVQPFSHPGTSGTFCNRVARARAPLWGYGAYNRACACVPCFQLILIVGPRPIFGLFFYFLWFSIVFQSFLYVSG